jgi:beta-lactamase class D
MPDGQCMLAGRRDNSPHLSGAGWMVSWVTQPSEQLPFAANVCMIDAAVVLDAGNTPTATAKHTP